jgi:hypothetical protein
VTPKPVEQATGASANPSTLGSGSNLNPESTGDINAPTGSRIPETPRQPVTGDQREDITETPQLVQRNRRGSEPIQEPAIHVSVQQATPANQGQGEIVGAVVGGAEPVAQADQDRHRSAMNTIQDIIKPTAENICAILMECATFGLACCFCWCCCFPLLFVYSTSWLIRILMSCLSWIYNTAGILVEKIPNLWGFQRDRIIQSWIRLLNLIRTLWGRLRILVLQPYDYVVDQIQVIRDQATSESGTASTAPIMSSSRGTTASTAPIGSSSGSTASSAPIGSSSGGTASSAPIGSSSGGTASSAPIGSSSGGTASSAPIGSSSGGTGSSAPIGSSSQL